MQPQTTQPSSTKPIRDPLHDAIDDNDIEGMIAILACDKDPNTPNEAGGTPLHVVCGKSGDKMAVEIRMAEILLHYGADIDAHENFTGWTPLMMAVLRNKPHLVEFFVARGADCFITDLEGKTALDLLHQSMAAYDVEKPEHQCIAEILVPVFTQRRIDDVANSQPVAGQPVEGLPQIKTVQRRKAGM